MQNNVEATTDFANKPLFFIGFMGTGKSSLCRYLIKETNKKVVELDAVVEAEAGKSIQEIFSEDGEDAFRSLETQALMQAAKEKNVLVSCGGGVILRQRNVNIMRKAGYVILLTATANTLEKRLLNDRKRPLLAENRNIETIHKMFQKRENQYSRAADISIETDGKTIDEIAQEVKVCLPLLYNKERLVMRPVLLRDCKVGFGHPVICVPLVGKTFSELKDEAELAIHSPTDLVEWRVDMFENRNELHEVQEVLHFLREKLENLPLLVSYRTQKEGGGGELEPSSYEDLLIFLAESGCCDAIDVEAYQVENPQRIIAKIQLNHVAVVASFHDFKATGSVNEIKEILEFLESTGANIVKVAMMPQSVEDVGNLIQATKEIDYRSFAAPVMTISMGNLGVYSRINGELTGSAITFGALKRESAPGQLPVVELFHILEHLHRERTEENASQQIEKG